MRVNKMTNKYRDGFANKKTNRYNLTWLTWLIGFILSGTSLSPWLLSASLPFRALCILLSALVGLGLSDKGAQILWRSASRTWVWNVEMVCTGNVTIFMSSGNISKPPEPFGFDSVCYCRVHLQGRSHCFVSDSAAQLHPTDDS